MTTKDTKGSKESGAKTSCPMCPLWIIVFSLFTLVYNLLTRKNEYSNLEAENSILKAEAGLFRHKLFGTSSEQQRPKPESEQELQPSIFNKDEQKQDGAETAAGGNTGTEAVAESKTETEAVTEGKTETEAVAAGKTEAEEEDEPSKNIPVRAHTRKKAGRKPISKDLRRVIITNDLSEEEKTCPCGKKFTNIGKDETEKLVYIKADVYVQKTETLKYTCPCDTCRDCGCEHWNYTAARDDPDTPQVPSPIHTAPTPPALLPGSISTASLLSHIFIAKFCDGLPYYRVEKQFERIGVPVSRQDMANWQVAVFRKLKPLLDLMTQRYYSQPQCRLAQVSHSVIKGMGV
ncbi:hypothetical protein FACS1894200_01260 [Spirochaetia bacterium]|nr:hypothetical protein FACS1894200_01260 [Spirochaetia bacterium]